jgi:branched-chain amino acid transport system substrate-binding protein
MQQVTASPAISASPARRRPFALALVLVAALAVLVGCGDSASGGSGDADAAIKATMIVDETGVAAFAAVPVRDGVKFGVAEINAKDGIDGRKIDLTIEDTGSNQTQAVNLMTKAVKDSDVVLFGNLSNEALAIAPIAQRAKVPMIAIQSGSPGVVETGDYIYRISTPAAAFLFRLTDYIKKTDAKTVSVIGSTDNPTLKGMVDKDFPEQLAEGGIKVVSKDEIKVTDTDFTAMTAKIAKLNPDVVSIFAVGKPNLTIITQLRRAGYRGRITGSHAIAGDILAPLGKMGDGIVFPITYTPTTDMPTGKAFAEAYEAKTGKLPNNFTAEGYDATKLLEAAVTASGGDISHDGIKEGLAEAAAKGVVGATGNPIKFEGRDARVTGVLVEWQDGKEIVAPPPR